MDGHRDRHLCWVLSWILNSNCRIWNVQIHDKLIVHWVDLAASLPSWHTAISLICSLVCKEEETKLGYIIWQFCNLSQCAITCCTIPSCQDLDLVQYSICMSTENQFQCYGDSTIICRTWNQPYSSLFVTTTWKSYFANTFIMWANVRQLHLISCLEIGIDIFHRIFKTYCLTDIYMAWGKEVLIFVFAEVSFKIRLSNFSLCDKNPEKSRGIQDHCLLKRHLCYIQHFFESSPLF